MALDLPMQTLTVNPREPAHSARNGASRGEPGLADVVKNTAADVVHLATAELRLARLEVTEGIRNQVGRVVLMAVAAVPMLVAYLLGVAALVAWVRPWLGTSGALAAVALSQAALGGVVVAVGSTRHGAKSGHASAESAAKQRDGAG